MPRGFAWLSVIFSIILCTLSVAAAAQSTINVPADQSTIQTAINAANNGDTVLVAPGTYPENLSFNGKAITVTSSGGPAVTIVDGGGAGPVVIFNANEGASSVLNGFTLQNGVPSSTFPNFGTSGAGIWIYYASPTITNNVITGNHAICGIGIEIQGGSAVIRGNTITGNAQAGGDGGCGGGGIEVTGDSSHPVATPQIIGNTITNNSLPGGGFGGGIEVSYFSSPTIRNNYIAGNSVYNSGGGIDLESYEAPVVIQNIIVNNSTGGGGSGGGIYVSSSPAVVANNTIVGNTAFDGSSGIFAYASSAIPISSNIVVAASGQNGIVCSPFSSTLPNFSHNDVTSPGSGGQAWSSSCGSAAQSNGNISADPQFADAVNGDYHLQAGSPAIDAGDNNAPNLPEQDYDGNPRIAVGSATSCSSTVDIGVYEFVLSTTPAATLSPAALDFGGVSVGASTSPQSLTFAATQGCVAKPAITVSGDYHETDNCTSVLGTGASCSIQVTFSPVASGTRTGSLAVTSGDMGLSTSLTGQGQTGVATLSPSSLSYANQLVNTSSAAQTVTLSNTSNGPLQINSIAISGDFSQSNSCPASLAANSSCLIQVIFQPTATGARGGSLSVSSNSVPSATAVSLSGTGVQPAISVSPVSVAFGDQVLNTTASYQTVTVSNPGSATLHVNALLISGDPDLYTVTNNCVGGTGTAPGGSCSIQIGFTPRSPGPASATLNITSDAPGSPTSVALSGNGVDAAPTLSPTSISFGSQSVNTNSAAQTVTLSNTNSVPLQITSIGISGDFSQSNNCPASPASLSANSSCLIQVTFRPTATGARSGSLNISSNSVPSTTAVSLSGTGVQPAINVSPASVAFGDQVLNTSASYQTVTVTNPGSGTLHVNALTISGDPDLYTATNNCVGGAGTLPGGSCSIQIGFTPRSLGPASATLSITSDAPGSPTSVALSGNGVDAAPTLSPTSLGFGNVFVGKHSGGKTVKLTSNGPAALAISVISVSAGFVQSNNCPATLNPGSTCDINVSFKPLAAGVAAGMLSIADNSYGSPHTVALSGNGSDFSVSASPASATVIAGQKASYTVTASALGGSYNTNVALSCSALPAGVQCSFSPSGVSPGSTSINSALTVSTTSGSTGTPPGSYTFTINGRANGTTHSTTVELVVN
jgi:hypothetical protein